MEVQLCSKDRKVDEVHKKVPTLLDLCAKVVGRNESCDNLAKCNPPLDEELLTKVSIETL